MARMENGGIELRGEAGRSDSCGHGAFFVFHLHRVDSFSFLFSTSWKFIHFVAGIYYTTFFVIFQE